MEITEAAREKILEVLANTDKVFKVCVKSGGCSGFSYSTEVAPPMPEDIYIDDKIVVNKISQEMLTNVIVDYVDTIAFSGFTFKNPDASSTCGCGISFDF